MNTVYSAVADWLRYCKFFLLCILYCDRSGFKRGNTQGGESSVVWFNFILVNKWNENDTYKQCVPKKGFLYGIGSNSKVNNKDWKIPILFYILANTGSNSFK